MQTPTFFAPRPLDADTWQLGGWLPVPGLGVLPVNAYLIKAPQPVLIDTGAAAWRDDFLAALARVIDPAALRWIWITHMDADHVGNLQAVLARAPQARVVTTFLGLGKMGLLGLPQERAWLLNPGQTLDVGDRGLTALVPPIFDAPETTALLDGRTRTLFSADAFGAVLPEVAENEASITDAALRDGMRLWASVDAPWLALAGRSLWHAALARVQALRPDRVLSSHLPPSRDLDGRLLAALAGAIDMPPFVGPDQQALQAALAAAA
ncbi:MAG: MBL fold metallo-hydrolase [Piscinibacter sp.]|nr:MBL fold metallo-hydrolase [Piscinibacter sp.]